MKTKPSTVLFVLFTIGCLLCSCATVVVRNPLPEALSNDAQPPGMPRAKFWGDEVPPFFESVAGQPKEKLKQEFSGIYGKEHTYLAISGGGSNGAFGAGILVGWTEAGTRPEFTMVTGISTGALIAPFAFLGSEYDDELKEVIDRIVTPPLDQIPDVVLVKSKEIDLYTLPYTVIRIQKMSDGPRKGEFLFNSQTVEETMEFYNRVNQLPYKPGASVGAYEDYRSQPGPMIPKALTRHLPQWTTIRVWGVAIWKHLFLLFAFMAIGAIIFFLNRFIRVKSEKETANIMRMLCRIVTIIILIVVLFNASEYFGISLTAVFASAGLVGMAAALAARETISNIFGGISLLLDHPFRMGDYITLDTGERGKVLEVGLRSTRILTRDDIQITIPNSVITNTKIVNESAPRNSSRVRIKVGVAYGSDIEKVEEVLLRTASEEILVKKTPPPSIRLRGFGASSVEFELLCHNSRAEDRGQLIHSLYWSIYMAFKAEGIVIPLPQRDIHINHKNSSEFHDGPKHERP